MSYIKKLARALVFVYVKSTIRNGTKKISNSLTSVFQSAVLSPLGKVAPKSYQKNLIGVFCAVAGVGAVSYLDLNVIAQGLGLIGGVVAATAPYHKENDHTRAQMAVGQAVFAVHLGMIDAWSAATVSGVTAIRAVLQGMVGEKSYKSKTAIAVGGFAAAASLYTLTHGVTPIFQMKNIPFAVMAIASIAEAMPSSKSYISRPLYLSSAAALIAYHGLESGSLAGVAVNALSVGLTTKAIIKHDIAPKIK